MLLLVSGATRHPRSDTVGHLIVPKQGNDPRRLGLQPGRWAMDNGAFSGFDAGAFVRMLHRFNGIPGCLFVTAPDVVGDAACTLDLWPFWSRLIRGVGHAPALVAQDGLRPNDVPWDEIGALFVGGTTAWKEGVEARTLCGVARAKGVWVHWGRVNTKRRYEMARIAGAQSIDGSGFSMYPDTNIPKVTEWERDIEAQPCLA